MGRADRREEQSKAVHAWLTDDRTPVQERGWAMVGLIAHAYAFLLLSATEAIWAAVTAARVWRRRGAGLTEAVRTGVHKPTLAGLLAAHLLYKALRTAGWAELSRRATGQPGRR
jgi:hypothetical protein